MSIRILQQKEAALVAFPSSLIRRSFTLLSICLPKVAASFRQLTGRDINDHSCVPKAGYLDWTWATDGLCLQKENRHLVGVISMSKNPPSSHSYDAWTSLRQACCFPQCQHLLSNQHSCVADAYQSGLMEYKGPRIQDCSPVTKML